MPKVAEIGPTGARVAENVHALRKARGLNLQTLSDRLAELDRPITLASLSTLENRTRRVDADDLVALAIALGTTPNRLMLPPAADDSQVPLVGPIKATARAAWRWMRGLAPLDNGPADEDVPRDFTRENSPDEPSIESATFGEAIEHWPNLQPVVAGVGAAISKGVPANVVIAYVTMVARLPSPMPDLPIRVTLDDGTDISAEEFDRRRAGGEFDGRTHDGSR
jgi:transcriptional regulator with XRE-family HTH domain